MFSHMNTGQLSIILEQLHGAVLLKLHGLKKKIVLTSDNASLIHSFINPFIHSVSQQIFIIVFFSVKDYASTIRYPNLFDNNPGLCKLRVRHNFITKVYNWT